MTEKKKAGNTTEGKARRGEREDEAVKRGGRGRASQREREGGGGKN